MDERGFVSEEERRAKPPQHSEEYRRGVYACGARREHQVRIHRAHWPPKQHPNLNDKPYVTALCQRCGATCIVYDPVPHDMTVILYGDPSEAQGQVIEEGIPPSSRHEEPGLVMEEAPHPQAGQVLEEPEPRKGRR